jgi:hypothetical protein
MPLLVIEVKDTLASGTLLDRKPRLCWTIQRSAA